MMPDAPTRTDTDALLHGVDLFGDRYMTCDRPGPVGERFAFPPFTALNAQVPEWMERKRAWIRTGIRSEIGRAARSYHISEWLEGQGKEPSTDTSVFDPVLCELLYRWFCPDGGQVVDPFAGGSVRGIVAALLGRRYWGVDLSAPQIAANREQWVAMPHDGAPDPDWHVGDAIHALPAAPAADLIFSCPPYFDLEVYSDDPRDLSAMTWTAFRAAYRSIIRAAVERLRPDRFACFVVGDIRDNRGLFRNLPAETVAAFTAAGAPLYNEAILLTSVSTAAIRVTKQFEVSRKLAKVHQNVLIFLKGDAKRATAACRLAPADAVAEEEAVVVAIEREAEIVEAVAAAVPDPVPAPGVIPPRNQLDMFG